MSPNIVGTSALRVDALEKVTGAALYTADLKFPRLLHATPVQLHNYELLGDGEGIHWPDVDEDLSVAGLLRGTPASPKRA